MVSISISNSKINTIIDAIKELDDNDRHNLIECLNATKFDIRGGPRLSTNDANLDRDPDSSVDHPWLNSIKGGWK